MARRSGFKTQAPRTVTVLIAAILWIIGLLTVLGIVHPPNSLGIWSLVAAGFLLLLGSLVDGI